MIKISRASLGGILLFPHKDVLCGSVAPKFHFACRSKNDICDLVHSVVGMMDVHDSTALWVGIFQEAYFAET